MPKKSAEQAYCELWEAIDQFLKSSAPGRAFPDGIQRLRTAWMNNSKFHLAEPTTDDINSAYRCAEL